MAKVEEEYVPTLQTVGYVALTSILKLVYKTDDTAILEKHRNVIVNSNDWPVLPQSILLLESSVVYLALQAYASAGGRKSRFTNPYRVYRLNNIEYIDIYN